MSCRTAKGPGITDAPVARYLVEVASPVRGLTQVQALGEAARRAVDAARQRGASVRFLRVVFLPEDGSCLLLLEGESAQAVRSAVADAAIGAGVITAALAVGESEGGASPR